MIELSNWKPIYHDLIFIICFYLFISIFGKAVKLVSWAYIKS